MAIYISSTSRPAYLDAAARTVLHPQHLPGRVQRAFKARGDIIALTTQYGDIEENADTVSCFVLLKSGVFVIYEIPSAEVQMPYIFDLGTSGSPQSVTVWADEAVVFAMTWNPRGVFRLDRFEKGPWTRQVHRALARPDLHIL